MNQNTQWLPLSHLKQDLPASIAVFLVAIPLCLGIAHASNAPLLSGLIAGVIGGLVVGFVSKSPLSVSGPAAGLTAIVAAAAMELKSFEALLVATFLAGLIQIGLGILKAGSIASYIPSAVIRGMLSAIGIILILKQLPHLMGYDAESEGTESFVVHSNELEGAAHSTGHEGVGTTFTMLWDAVLNLDPRIFAIGLLSIATILIWDRTLGKRFRMLPSSLLAVLVGTGMTFVYLALGQNAVGGNHLVQLPQLQSWGDFVKQTAFPAWQSLSNPKVYTIAFTLAFVASIESLLSIEAIDKLDPHKRNTPTNRELIAQGMGNSLSGLIGGLPMTSVIVRSSVNLVAGAESKLSTMLHGFWIVLALVFASSIINLIPLASLAAVLIMTGLKLASPKQMSVLYRSGRDQFIPYIITVVTIVVTDLLIGVLVGLAVSGAFILYNHYRSNVVNVKQQGTQWTLNFGENLTFLNKARIEDLLESVPDGTQVVLDTTHCIYIDHDVLESIQRFVSRAPEHNISVELYANSAENKKPVSETHADRLAQLTAEPVTSGGH